MTPDEIAEAIDNGSLPADTPGAASWSEGVSNDDVTEFPTSAKGLAVTATHPGIVQLENLDNVTFVSMWEAFENADGGIGFPQSDQWLAIVQAMTDEFSDFQVSLAQLEEAQGWVGKTHEAAMANLNQSFAQLQVLLDGIGTQATLLGAFNKTIFQTQWYFRNWMGPYYSDFLKFPNHRDQIDQAYNSFAQQVMSVVYGTNINEIKVANPAFATGQTPDVGTIPDPTAAATGDSGAIPPPADPGTPTLPSSITTPGTSGPSNPSGLTLPDPSSLANAGGGLAGLGPGLSNLAGGAGDGFDPSQLPGGASISALTPPGVPSDGFDPSQLPGGANISALTPPGVPSDGFDPSQLPGAANISAPDPSQLPGAANISAPDPSQLNPVSPADPNGTSLPGNLPGSPDGTGDGSGGLSGLGSLGSGLSGLSGMGSPGGGGGGPAGAANGASGLGSQLSSALGPASDALKSATGAGQPLGGSVPGGMPGMDPKDLNSANEPGPDGAHAGGGGGAGIGGRGLDPARPGGAPVAGLGRGPALAGAPRLGSPGSQTAGAGGGGAPPGGGGGGQRGPAGKEHKANKALRRKRNGELVIGDPEAVVPVIGEDDADTEATESVPQTTPPTAVPPVRRSPPAPGARRAGLEQLRAELEL
jgi:hypothetical protein